MMGGTRHPAQVIKEYEVFYSWQDGTSRNVRVIIHSSRGETSHMHTHTNNSLTTLASSFLSRSNAVCFSCSLPSRRPPRCCLFRPERLLFFFFVCFSVFASSSLNLTASAPEEDVRRMFVLLPHSEKPHHVVDLPHVDAFQWKCVPPLLRDPVALSKTDARSEPLSFFFLRKIRASAVKLAWPYIAGIAGWRPLVWLSFWQHSIFIRK